MPFRFCVLVLLAGLLAVPGPVGAQSRSDLRALREAAGALRQCDGHAGASPAGDGILVPMRSVDALGRLEPTYAVSLASCDIAIPALERAAPQHVVRLVSLYQSRAIHRFMASDLAGAMADLEQADLRLATVSDPGVLRTLGVNAKLIRALLLEAQERGSGDPLLSAALAARPYNRMVLEAAVIALAPDRNDALRRDLMRRFAQLDPERTRQLAADQRHNLGLFFMAMLDPESATRRARGWEASGSGAARRSTAAILRSPCYTGEILTPNAQSGPGDVSMAFCDFSFGETPAWFEDKVLRKVAETVIGHGRRYFQILRRRDLAHLATSEFSRSPDPSGFEVHLIVRLTGEPCALCLDAEDVARSLATPQPAP